MSNYWKEVVPEIVAEIGITLSDEQMQQLIEGIEGCAENQWMWFGQPASRVDYKTEEIKKLKDELEREQSKIVCNVCEGSGQERYIFGYSSCVKCGGSGKILPYQR